MKTPQQQIDEVVEKCLLTKKERLALFRAYYSGKAVDVTKVQYEDYLSEKQLLKAIPIISEEARLEERRDYERKLTLKEEVVTKRVSEEIKRELEEELSKLYEQHDKAGRKTNDDSKVVTKIYFISNDRLEDYWRKRGVK